MRRSFNFHRRSSEGWSPWWRRRRRGMIGWSGEDMHGAWGMPDSGLTQGGGWLRSAAVAVPVAAATRSSSRQRCPGIATLKRQYGISSVPRPTRWSRCITQPRYGADLLPTASSPLTACPRLRRRIITEPTGNTFRSRLSLTLYLASPWQDEAVVEFGSRGRRPVDDSYDYASGSWFVGGGWQGGACADSARY